MAGNFQAGHLRQEHRSAQGPQWSLIPAGKIVTNLPPRSHVEPSEN
jgi:hypothetical protein